jgi:RNA polymerase sigma-32 factor
MTFSIEQKHTRKILTQEEEIHHITQFKKHKNSKSLEILVKSFSPYIEKIACQFSGYAVDKHDLVQEGSIGLIKSIHRFDLSSGVRLASYATPWIKSEMHEHVVNFSQTIKMATTKGQRKTFFNLRRLRQHYNETLSSQDVTSLASALQVSESDVRTMESRFYHRVSSVDAPLPNGSTLDDDKKLSLSSTALNPATIYAQNEAIQNNNKARDFVFKLISTMPERERNIIEGRHLSENKKTLKSLAKEYDVSFQRIGQMEKEAMSWLLSEAKSSQCHFSFNPEPIGHVDC